jgi:hypothetical protein
MLVEELPLIGQGRASTLSTVDRTHPELSCTTAEGPVWEFLHAGLGLVYAGLCPVPVA